jgi:hypothetical protein
MRFMSTVDGQPTKFVRFDSSPGRAIAKKLGDGTWDETSYKAVLMEDRGDEKTYEVYLRRARNESFPDPFPHEKVGILHWTDPRSAQR